MRTAGKMLSFAGLPLGGAAAGYVYVSRVLRPAPSATARPSGQLDD